MQTIRGIISSTALFLRFEYLLFALILPILGAASVLQAFSAGHIIWLLISAFSFHIFISLQNDIVDLPLDRTDPRRRDYPLVSGTVSRKFAVVLALLQIPFLLAASTWWGAKGLLFLSVFLVIGMMTIYNMWGKRTKNPLFTDLAQGFGFAGITLFGAASSGSPTVFTPVAFFGVILWMMFTNLMGGMRDLQRDHAFQLVTTPIFLGSRYENARYYISEKSKVYSYFLVFLHFIMPITLIRGRIVVANAPLLVILGIGILLVWIAVSAALKRFFEIASNQFRVEFDLALIVMYLTALPMLAVLALNRNVWVIISALVVILAAWQKYLRFTKINKAVCN